MYNLECKMRKQEITLKGYPKLLLEIKERVRSAQYEALKAVNKELVGLYWDIGKIIVRKQYEPHYGKAVVYGNSQKLAPLVRELAWSHNVDGEELNSPIGVATYSIKRNLPKELQKQLPKPQDISNLLDAI